MDSKDNPLATVPAFLRDLIPEFIANRQDDLQAVRRAGQDGDYDTVRTLGHQMKGTGNFYGLPALSELGAALETAALAGESAEIVRLADQVSACLERLVNAGGTAAPAAGLAADPGTAPGPPASAPAGPALSAILADDSRAIRQGVSRLLEATGFRVVAQAADGREAAELCRQHAPDVVFLDILMPHTSGMEALETIRTAVPQTRVVMFTTIAERETVLRTKQLGALDYILKPFKDDELRQKLVQLRARILKEKAS
ncbi:MAG: response regulator [Kiritimatiellae bacterium]|nr:response regulator [Kiritimatiellia bacterium]